MKIRKNFLVLSLAVGTWVAIDLLTSVKTDICQLEI